MTDIGINRLYLPGLASTYDRLRPLAWPMLRIAAGLIMIPHGIPKLFGTFAPVLAKTVLAPLGFPEPLYVAYFLGALEIFGGSLLAAGSDTAAGCDVCVNKHRSGTPGYVRVSLLI